MIILKLHALRNSLLSKAEAALDMPEGLLRDAPNVVLYGTSLAEIDNFKGLIDFSDSSMRVNTATGLIRIDGVSLFISSMTDDNLCVKGTIKNISFE